MLLDDGLAVDLGERVARFPAIWLRDNCPCPSCLDPGTRQKLTNLASLPADCAIAALQLGAESVEVVFAPDGHRSVFSRAWLAAHALPEPTVSGVAPGDGRDEVDKVLWQVADLELPERTWAGYRDDPAQREFCLDAVLRYGFVLLREVPAEPGMVLTVAGSFGYPRETNYGRLFDVRVQPDPDHLASTSREITPHTDNPYRDPVPTVQLLHCLRNAAQGGDTSLLDGFAAAASLRASDPEAFATLAATPVPFAYRDAGTELRASRPLIETSRGGQVRGVRFNNRTIQPLRLSYDEVTRFYRACRRWAALLAEPRWRLDLRLAPGDCLIFDNTRILHARTAFTAATGGGDRLLQGCYADLDSLTSSLAVLRRGAPA
jgi:gamma-butyrobetaine dioxygenase